jgi:hypothetical protein
VRIGKPVDLIAIGKGEGFSEVAVPLLLEECLQHLTTEIHQALEEVRLDLMSGRSFPGRLRHPISQLLDVSPNIRELEFRSFTRDHDTASLGCDTGTSITRPDVISQGGFLFHPSLQKPLAPPSGRPVTPF